MGLKVPKAYCINNCWKLNSCSEQVLSRVVKKKVGQRWEDEI